MAAFIRASRSVAFGALFRCSGTEAYAVADKLDTSTLQRFHDVAPSTTVDRPSARLKFSDGLPGN
jgi:hypothetical protein